MLKNNSLMKENDNRVHMLSYNNYKKEQLYERYVGAQKLDERATIIS
jgi:hypothetical protein